MQDEGCRGLVVKWLGGGLDLRAAILGSIPTGSNMSHGDDRKGIWPNCSHAPVKVLPWYLDRHVQALEQGSQRH